MRTATTGTCGPRRTQRRALVRSREQWEAELATAERLAEAFARRRGQDPRKVEKPGFGHGAFRARDRTHGSSGALRRAKVRTEHLRSNEAAAPVEPLHFMPGPLPGPARPRGRFRFACKRAG